MDTLSVNTECKGLMKVCLTACTLGSDSKGVTRVSQGVTKRVMLFGQVECNRPTCSGCMVMTWTPFSQVTRTACILVHHLSASLTAISSVFKCSRVHGCGLIEQAFITQTGHQQTVYQATSAFRCIPQVSSPF